MKKIYDIIYFKIENNAISIYRLMILSSSYNNFNLYHLSIVVTIIVMYAIKNTRKYNVQSLGTWKMYTNYPFYLKYWSLTLGVSTRLSVVRFSLFFIDILRKNLNFQWNIVH